ncbi:uncharacterized protein LOC115967116 [Quercus lobata]|uniref:uncharacterized protein LOC115967116 n=1 Tax=Quercus lobata TaxID=97700 RepID=UPI001247F34E|nr:uncharacterized protein LOC115967116 [Quercus lobata]
MENDDRPVIVFGGYDCRKPASHRSKTMEMEWELDISVVSIQKYPMDHDIEILDALLLQPTVSISAALLKQPQEEPVAEMMDCKNSQIAANGRIGSYIHDSHIGVLIEVNCETDFVCRSENFKDLVDDLAMQVAVCPKVQFVSIENIPESFVNKERELEMQRDDDLLSKPENIREKIVEGRVSKMLRELAILEQPFNKNDNILVKDLLKQTIATIGENIEVKRFVRFTLGETIENTKTGIEA